jgi:Tol biopolymer transport system component
MIAALAAACAGAALGLGSADATTSTRGGVIITVRAGRVVAVNADGSGVKELTHGTPAVSHPVASPDGSEIAFDDYSYVYVVNSDGTGQRRLAAGAWPQWSPDGRWLAYQGNLAHDWVIGVMRPDGSELHSVAQAIGFSWSPDSTSIAYTAGRGISAVNVITGERRQLVRHANAGNPSWSPDGRYLAFTAGPDYEPRLYVAALDGSPARKVGPPAGEPPVWSPDGTRLAYGTYICCESTGDKMAVVDVTSGRTLFSIPPIARGASGHPAWSPDGSRLVFDRANTAGSLVEDSYGNDVWLVNADGTGLAQVTTAFPYDGVGAPLSWLPGTAAIDPDPEIETVPLRTIARRSTRDWFYIPAADRSLFAVDKLSGYNYALGTWRSSGRIAWMRNSWANSAGFAGRRLYWADNERHAGYRDADLWTVRRSGGRPRSLRSESGAEGSPYQPFFEVAGDGSLSVYTLHRSLWRLQGTRARRIRRERSDLELFDVDAGRVLLRVNRRAELVASNGRLLQTFASDAKYVDGQLSGNRVVLVDRHSISVFDAQAGALLHRWAVGAPGAWPSVGPMYESLLPYGSGTALHVLDVDTGRDLIVRIPGVTWWAYGAINRAGLLYEWRQSYSPLAGRIGLVPLADLVAALRASDLPR